MTVYRPGVSIADRYKLVRLLGEGGMGEVWAAQHGVTRKSVALKFLKGATRPDAIRRFLREARAASAVRHPNVIAIHDVLAHDGLPVMVMDLLDGESLGQRLERDGRVGLAELAALLVPVLSALGTAHSLGIVHRDLKPDNIFLSTLPDGRVEPKVLDFGVAKLSRSDGEAASTGALTQTGAMIGTPYYMAPEQAFGEKDVDHRADVWAVGVILYQCLSGARPIDGENLGQLFRALMSGAIAPLDEVAPELPRAICDMVMRMLVVDRARRAPDLREAFEALRGLTDAANLSFSAPSAPLSFDRPTGGGELAVALADTALGAAERLTDARADAWEDTVMAALAASPSMTAGALSSSVAAAPAARRPARFVAAVAVGALAVAGGGALLARGVRAPVAPAAASTARSAESAPEPSSSAPSAAPEPPRASASTSAPPPASSSAPVVGKPPARVPDPPRAPKDAPPAAAPAPPAPSKPAHQLPAGMQADAPF